MRTDYSKNQEKNLLKNETKLQKKQEKFFKTGTLHEVKKNYCIVNDDCQYIKNNNR